MDITEPSHRTGLIDRLTTDGAFALLLAGFLSVQVMGARLFVLFGSPPPPRVGPVFFEQVLPTWLSFALLALVTLPLTLRRVYPVPVLATVTVAAAAFSFGEHPRALVILGPIVALYTVATLYDRRTTVFLTLAAAVPLLASSLPPLDSARWIPEFIGVVAAMGAAAAFGDATRNRRAYVQEVERRAEEAELRAEEEALRRVDEERLRIARELHDITAHSMSVIAVQSGAAMHVIEKDPESTRRALEEIRNTSKHALQELRSVLGVMRAAGESGTPTAPTPGLARLEDLVRPLRDAGFDVRVDVEGDLRTLPQLVDSSAYRILQEALTNVMRHAGPTEVDVTVRGPNGVLVLGVVSGGAEGATPAEGHGIAGMRERALALRGTFTAGPLEGGRWRVAATLPTGRLE